MTSATPLTEAAVSGAERRRWWSLGALSFSLFMIFLDLTVVNVALPAISEDLGLGLASLEWVVNAYTLVFAVLLLPGGKLADFFGRRRTFIAGLVVFTAASFMCALATSGDLLIGARAAQGLGAALMLPATLSIITATFPPHERGTAIGVWAGMSLLAIGIGPFAGGLLVQHLAWNWIFYVNVPIGILGIVLARLTVQESRDMSAEQRLDIPGLLVLSGGLFALTFGLIEANRYGWGSATILACFAAAAVLLAVFVVLEQRQRLPMLDLALFRNKTFTGGTLVALLSLLSMLGVFFFLSIFMQVILGFSPVETGALFLPMTLALVVATPFAGRIADRYGSRIPMTVGMLYVGFSMIVVSRVHIGSSVWEIVPPLILGGIGFGLTTTPSTVAVVGSVSVDKAGVASGVVNAARQVGGTLGIAVMGAIVLSQIHEPVKDSLWAWHFVEGYRHALLAGGTIAVAGAVVAFTLVGTHRAFQSQETAGSTTPMARRTRLLLVTAGVSLVAAVGIAAAFTRSGDFSPVAAPFVPPALSDLAPAQQLTPASMTPQALSAAAGSATRRFEYVFPDREMYVYDIDRGFRLVQRVRLPEAHEIRGAVVDTRARKLYLTIGGNGGTRGAGSLLKLDLLTLGIEWGRALPTGVDYPALSKDGRTLYLPVGERSSNGDVWYVIRTRDGAVVDEIHGGSNPHNTVLGPRGDRIYMGPTKDTDSYLTIASTRTNRVVQRIGPMLAGVRPFTFDGDERFVYSAVTGFIGFQVGSIATGKVIHTVPVPGVSWDSEAYFFLISPSHGIALTPDSRRLWLMDSPHHRVHEFDVSGVPGRAPRLLASVRLSRPMLEREVPCGGEDCFRIGWLQMSMDGRYLFVGDSGDVIDARTREKVAYLPALRNSRHMMEIDWRNGVPVATTTRVSTGRP